MISGLLVLAVAALTLAALMLASRHRKPHGNPGCDCGDCERWNIRERLRRDAR